MIIETARDAADLMMPLFHGCSGEKVVAAHLDSSRRLVGMTEAGGEADSVALPIRSILDDALRLGASGLVVAHNHPSGDPNPSEADLHATRALAASAGSLGIDVLDHILIGAGGDCRSLRALGLM